MYPMMIQVYHVLIVSVPFAAAVFPILLAPNLVLRIAVTFLAPFLLIGVHLLLCGLLSWPFRRAVVAGKTPRTLANPLYARRRLHAMCWTYVCFSPFYYIFLSVTWVKWLMLRLFGYKGSTDFTVYPDVWLRDLPVLTMRSGAYLANRSSIGSNLIQKDGNIYLGAIEIGERAIISHLAMIGPDSLFENDADIGQKCACGVKFKIGERSVVRPCSALDHMSKLGADVEIGTRAFLGIGVKVSDGVKIPPNASIPAKRRLRTQSDVAKHILVETESLRRMRDELMESLRDDVGE